MQQLIKNECTASRQNPDHDRIQVDRPRVDTRQDLSQPANVENVRQ
jgi:hypothetical protein